MSNNPTPQSPEFLVELDEKESLVVLQQSFLLKTDLVVKPENDPTAYKTIISGFLDTKVILDTEHFDRLAEAKGIATIKFSVGAEIYFVKTLLTQFQNKICFSKNIKVVHLKRRKEPRYVIPTKWNQLAHVWDLETKSKMDARVLDISKSGIKFEIKEPKFSFQKEKIARIQFQIYKRAEVVCDAEVRFFAIGKTSTALMGMSLVLVTENQKSRIESIIEDLILYNTQNPE